MKKYVKFTGNFRDLKPNGWRFWKASARNHRVYTKECDGEYSQSCSIWQHLGGYMEIEDYYSNSYILVEKIAKGEIDEWITDQSCIFTKKPEKICWVYYDLQEKTFHPYHSEEYRNIRNSKWDKWKELEEKKISDEDYDKWNRAFHERYRDRDFDLELFDMIKDLVDKGWIEVAEDNRKRR